MCLFFCNNGNGCGKKKVRKHNAPQKEVPPSVVKNMKTKVSIIYVSFYLTKHLETCKWNAENLN